MCSLVQFYLEEDMWDHKVRQRTCFHRRQYSSIIREGSLQRNSGSNVLLCAGLQKVYFICFLCTYQGGDGARVFITTYQSHTVFWMGWQVSELFLKNLSKFLTFSLNSVLKPSIFSTVNDFS